MWDKGYQYSIYGWQKKDDDLSEEIVYFLAILAVIYFLINFLTK